MPTYKNKTYRTIATENRVFPPQKEVETEKFLDAAAYPELMMVKEEPYYTPVKASMELNGSGEYVVEDPNKIVSVKIVSIDPMSVITVNKNTPNIAVTEATPLELRSLGKIKYIVLKSGHVQIEEWLPLDFVH